MTTEDFLSRLDGLRARGPGKWSARCPSHPDRSPSLSIGEGEEGRILLYCHALCSPEQICKAVGCRTADLFSDTRGHGQYYVRTQPKSSRLDWDARAFQFRFHADALWLRAQTALNNLIGINVSNGLTRTERLQWKPSAMRMLI